MTSFANFFASHLWRALMPWWLFIAAMLPLAILHAWQLWQQPQYQFFPLIYGFVGYVLYQEARWNGPADPIREKIASVLTYVTVAIFGIALIIHSPYLMQVGLMTAIVVTLCRLATSMTIYRIAAVVSLLLLTAIPYSLSLKLSQELQRITAYASSGMLDYLNVPHIRTGNLIETVTQTLFVEEACSGIHSLFAALSVIMILVVYHRRPVVLSLLAILSVPVWAVVGNIVRVVSIAVAESWYQYDLAHGFAHDVLGFLIFALIAILLYAFDHLINVLLAAFELPRDGEGHPPIIEAYNRFVLWPNGRSWGIVTKRRKAASSVQPELPSANAESDPVHPSRDESNEPLIKPLAPWLKPAAICVLCLSVIEIGLAALAAQRTGTTLVPIEALTPVAMSQLPSDRFFPEKIDDWQVLRYEKIKREIDSFLWGEHSNAWNMMTPKGPAVCSLDYLFEGIHPLEVCYTNTGWTVQNISEVQLPTEVAALARTPADPNNPNTVPVLFELKMYHEQKKLHGVVMYVAFGIDGDFRTHHRGNWTQSIGYRFRNSPFLSWLAKKEVVKTGDNRVFQFQVFCQKTDEFQEKDRDAIRQKYYKLLSMVQPTVMKAVSSTPPSSTEGASK